MPARITVIRTANFEEARAKGGEVHHRFLYHAPTRTFIIGGPAETHGHLYEKLKFYVKPRETEVLVSGYATESGKKGNRFDLTALKSKEKLTSRNRLAIVNALKEAGFKKARGSTYSFVEREYFASHARVYG